MVKTPFLSSRIIKILIDMKQERFQGNRRKTFVGEVRGFSRSSGEADKLLGARLRGCTATQRSKKGSEKVLGRVLGKGFSEGF